jgi:hypothetical protein
VPIKITFKNDPHSNKNKTLPQKPDPIPSATSPTSPSPFIDRMSVTLSVPKDEEAKGIHSHIWTQLENSDVFWQGKFKKNGYMLARRIKIRGIADTKKWPLLQYSWDKHAKVASSFRIEFNPDDLGLDGLNYLNAGLCLIMPDGWGYFVKHGRVTMIEISVDFPGLGMEQFRVLPQQGLYTKAWGKGGILETLVLGKPKGNQTRI